MGLRQYIQCLEEVVIRALSQYGIVSSRDAHATGVWLDTDTLSARKICAIGVKSSRFVTMHGFALNVNTEMDYYRYIHPCGIVDKGVTSMQQELGSTVDFEEVKKLILKLFLEIFDAKINF